MHVKWGSTKTLFSFRSFTKAPSSSRGTVSLTSLKTIDSGIMETVRDTLQSPVLDTIESCPSQCWVAGVYDVTIHPQPSQLHGSLAAYSNHARSVLSQNRGGMEPKRTATCIVLKTLAKITDLI
ncbi:hypothetical protein TNCV_527121 [Trichonephila clavipes]|nr:hypothetical protein TNCV_527121 [Trichonephila clavipes]